MFRSLKFRGLAAGLIVSIGMLLVALYGQGLLKDSERSNQQQSMELIELNQSLNSIKKPISGIQFSLLEFLLNLNEQDREPVRRHLQELRKQVLVLRQNALIRQHYSTRQNSVHILALQQQLVSTVEVILGFDYQQRFPLLQLQLEELDALDFRFQYQIKALEELALSLRHFSAAEQIGSIPGHLKYLWQQSAGIARQMVASRSGIFGDPLVTIRALQELAEVSQQEWALAIAELSGDQYPVLSGDELRRLKLDLELSYTALKNILNRLAIDASAVQWRNIEALLLAGVKSIIVALNQEMAQLELLDAELTERHMARMQYASEQLSSFLWLLVFAFLALIMSTYLVFEYWIRRPIETVALAMQSEAKQVTCEPLQLTGAIEIDYLIEAFAQMQKQIRWRQQRLTSILQNAGEGIILIDNEFRIDSFNQAAEKIFGFTHQQVITQPVTRLFDPANPQLIERMLSDESLQGGENWHYLCSGLHADGSAFPMDLTISQMQLVDKRFRILVVRDASQRIANENTINQARLDAEQMQQQLARQVTQLDLSLKQLKKTQKQLVEAEKMASLAGLVAGVAHEINTPIGVSVTASSHLHDELTTIQHKHATNSLQAQVLDEFIEDASTASSIILSNLKRAAALIKSFKQVAVDQSSDEVRMLNLHDYLDEVVLNLHPALKKTKHVVNIDVASDFHLKTMPGAISQIITNLVMNSLEHAYNKTDAGVITVSAALQHGDVELIYQDDGNGIEAKHLGKIFEPFYTTKRGKGGSGLGLHITYNLVTSTLKGSIQCVSTVGHGARFIIRFPQTLAA